MALSVTNVNEVPTTLALNNSTVAENSPSATVVGTLSVTDVDAGNTHTYSLVVGEGDTGNAAFAIEGNELRTAAALNFEGQSSYSVRVQATDQDGLFTEQAFTITVTDVNEAPTALGLSNTSVAENSPADTVVGTLVITDADAGNTHTYALVAGEGDSGNAAFTIVGNELRTAAALDFETQSSYSIRVRGTDQNSLSTDQVFTITVTNVNEAPRTGIEQHERGRERPGGNRGGYSDHYGRGRRWFAHLRPCGRRRKHG